jgi:DNA repair and recombination protein RAD52
MRKWKDIIKDLNEGLNVSLVQTRKVGGTTIPYLEGDVVIQAANRIFGHDGWSTYTESPVERFEIGIRMKAGKEIVVYTYTVPVRCAFHGLLEDGTIHTISKGDIGKNSTQSDAFQQHEMAISGCATDALKRCMRHLGNQFGLTLYDKDSDDFKIATGKKKTTTKKKAAAKKETPKKGAKASKTGKGSKSKKDTKKGKSKAAKGKDKAASKPAAQPQAVDDDLLERANAYVIPEEVQVDGEGVMIPDSGKTIGAILDSPLAITVLTWLAGLRASPNNLPPFDPNNEEEAKLQMAIRYSLINSELSVKLTGEELAVCNGE